jgi:hypothetical protein
MKLFFCSLFIFAGLVLTALSDVPPQHPPLGFKRIPSAYVVKLDKELPAYKFYVYQQNVDNKECKFEELKLQTETCIAVPGSFGAPLMTGVIAVPVKLMEEVKTLDNLTKLMPPEYQATRPAGLVIRSTRIANHDVKVNDPRTKIEIILTITPDDQKGVKFTAVETPPPANMEIPAESSKQPPAATMFAGLAFSLSMITTGLWWFRRTK